MSKKEKIENESEEEEQEEENEEEEEKEEKEEQEEEEEEEEKEISKEEERIVSVFDDIDLEYPIDSIIEKLENKGYSDPGEIILWAISEGLLYVSNIEDDSTVYVALTDEGEEAWKKNIEKETAF